MMTFSLIFHCIVIISALTAVNSQNELPSSYTIAISNSENAFVRLDETEAKVVYNFGNLYLPFVPSGDTILA